MFFYLHCLKNKSSKQGTSRKKKEGQQPRQSRIWRKWVSVLKVTQFTTHVRSCSAACVPLPLGVFHNTYKHTPSTITALFQRCLRVGIQRERKMKHTGLNICFCISYCSKCLSKKHSYISRTFIRPYSIKKMQRKMA